MTGKHSLHISGLNHGQRKGEEREGGREEERKEEERKGERRGEEGRGEERNEIRIGMIAEVEGKRHYHPKLVILEK